MKKGLKIALIVIAIVVICAAIAGFLTERHNSKYISKEDALNVAIAEAGVDTKDIIKTDVDFEKTATRAYYEVEIDVGPAEYEFKIDAKTGEILTGKVDVD